MGQEVAPKCKPSKWKQKSNCGQPSGLISDPHPTWHPKGIPQKEAPLGSMFACRFCTRSQSRAYGQDRFPQLFCREQGKPRLQKSVGMRRFFTFSVPFNVRPCFQPKAHVTPKKQTRFSLFSGRHVGRICCCLVKLDLSTGVSL